MHNEVPHFDIVIVGGGLVGISLALALCKLPLRIALLDASALEVPTQKTEGRALALSYTSARILAGIGVWFALEKLVAPILQVHVSDRGHFGLTRIKAEQEQVPALGYVIPALQLAAVLNDALKQASEITLLKNSKVVAMQKVDANWQLQLQTANGAEKISARLVVAADGTQSTIRELQAIATTRHDYQQQALVVVVTTSKPHHNTAYERFIGGGAIALLPHREPQRCTLVWSDNNARIEELLQLNDGEFIKQLQTHFGYRLGYFTAIAQRYTYPLQLVQAEKWVAEGLVLIGNAARTLHPIAAQGFNLGLRDVAFLVQVIMEAMADKQDGVALPVLEKYAILRSSDQAYYKKFTHNLIYLFNEDFLPLNCARNLYMLSLELFPPLKHRLARRLLGRHGYLPDLAQDIPL